jgi:NitT/TauT family transport system substrate-binding protein
VRELRIVVSRHSAFYSPLIATVAGGFLEREGFSASYRPMAPAERAQDLLAREEADVIQSAVSSSWLLLERGEKPAGVHFAQINQRDGFFLVGRQRSPAFHWKRLEGRTLLADHAAQPLAMLRYAVHRQGTDWSRIRVVDAGTPEQIADAFRRGEGDFAHLQGPAAQQLEEEGCGCVVASVGRSVQQPARHARVSGHGSGQSLPARILEGSPMGTDDAGAGGGLLGKTVFRRLFFVGSDNRHFLLPELGLLGRRAGDSA